MRMEAPAGIRKEIEEKAGARQPCMHVDNDGRECIYWALLEPKGYIYQFPRCFLHVKNEDFKLYKESIPDEVDILPPGHNSKGCQKPIQVSCCKTYHCHVSLSKFYNENKKRSSCPNCQASIIANNPSLEKYRHFYQNMFFQEDYTKYLNMAYADRRKKMNQHVDVMRQLSNDKAKATIPEVIEGFNKAHLRICREAHHLMLGSIDVSLYFPTFRKGEKRKGVEDGNASSSKASRIE